MLLVSQEDAWFIESNNEFDFDAAKAVIYANEVFDRTLREDHYIAVPYPEEDDDEKIDWMKEGF